MLLVYIVTAKYCRVSKETQRRTKPLLQQR
jgi:hypothetical protein